MNLEKADGIAKYACLLAGTANQAKAELIIRGAISQRHAGSGDPAYNAVGRVPSRGGIYGALYKKTCRSSEGFREEASSCLMNRDARPVRLCVYAHDHQDNHERLRPT